MAKKKAEEEAKEKARLDAEALAKLNAEKDAAEKARLEAQALAKKKAEEEAKEKARLDAEALAKLNAEKDAAEKARLEAQALAKKKAEEEAKEKARLDAEALAKLNAEKDAAEKARLEAQALAKKKAEEEAKEKARLEAEALAKLNSEKNAAEKARLEAQALAKKKAEEEAKEKARLEAEALAKLNSEKNAAEKARLEAQALAKKKAEEEAKEKARLEAEALAKLNSEKNAAEKTRLEAQALAKKKAEEEAKEKARLEAEALAKLNSEKNTAEKARLEAEALAKKKAEEEAKRRANELASKEALAKTKRDRDKKYTSLITRANNQFIENDYTSAKNTYISALGIKPNEAFPKQRISTINDKLNKLAQEKRNSIESTDDYFNLDADLYGTEVDMAGDDGTFLLTKIEDNSDRRKYMELKRYIDSTVSNNKKSDLKDINFSQLTYQKFEELSYKISNKTGANGYGRSGSITSIGLYLNAYAEDMKNQNDAASKSSLANYEALSKLNDTYIDINTTLAKRNNGLGEAYQKYADNNAELMNVNSLNHLKTNLETFAEFEKFKDKLSEENRYKQIEARKNDGQYIEYNDLRYDKNKELVEKEKISQKFEIDYLESTVKILKENKEAGNKKISIQNAVYSEYAESVADINRELQRSSSIKTATTNKEIEKLQDKMVSQTKTDQNRVKKFSKDYSDLNDKLVAKDIEMVDVEKESQKKINEKITHVKDNLSVQKSDEIKDGLALLFPEGVTQKVYQKKNKYGEITSMTVRRVVVIGNKGNDYLYKKSKTGSYYFKNGKSISEITWDLETSGKIIQ